MLHLIWQKDSGTLTSEDGQEIKGIRSKLLECYHWLYFEGEDTEAPPKLIAKNLIEWVLSLTSTCGLTLISS